jgi:DNA-binding NtrC family response regulator
MDRVRRALVVDDDPQVLRLFERWLGESGFTVAAAASFADARSRLESGEFEVLVVDVRLQEFNGLHLAVRARVQHPDMTIVVVSGFEDPVLRREAAACRAAYLMKPVERATFLNAIAGEESNSRPH